MFLFLMVPWVGLHCVIVACPDISKLLFAQVSYLVDCTYVSYSKLDQSRLFQNVYCWLILSVPLFPTAQKYRRANKPVVRQF